MNRDEYDSKLSKLNEEHDEKVKALIKEFCDSNSTIKIGDIVTDHMGGIYVSRIGYCMDYSGNPMCKYYGSEITKKLQPKKNGAKRWAYQSNVIVV